MVYPKIEVLENEKEKPFIVVGTPSVHFHPSIEVGTAGTTTAAIYSLYDELVSNYPQWIKRGEDLGTASDGVSIIRSYVVMNMTNAVYHVDSYGDENNYWNSEEYGYNYRKVLLNSGTHGSEPSAVWGLYYFIKSVVESNEGWACYIKSNLEIHIIPVLNPWGLDNSNRLNSLSQNINRNFPSSACIESNLFKTYATELQPFCFLDCHSVDIVGEGGFLGYVGVRQDHPNIGLMMRLANNAIALCQDEWDGLAQALNITTKPYMFGCLGTVYEGAVAWMVDNITLNAFVIEGPTLNPATNPQGKPVAKIHVDLLSNLIPMMMNLDRIQ